MNQRQKLAPSDYGGGQGQDPVTPLAHVLCKARGDTTGSYPMQGKGGQGRDPVTPLAPSLYKAKALTNAGRVNPPRNGVEKNRDPVTPLAPVQYKRGGWQNLTNE